jgi:hypothetical protein
VTINITLVTSTAIYQSSDYRLSDANTGRRIEMRGHKVVPVLGPPAMVCFTGIAATRRGETVGDWLARSLPELNPDITLEHVLETLKSADEWLRHWPKEVRRLSFTVSTWQNGHPTVILVSNFEDVRGRARTVGRLEMDAIQPRAPFVMATGLRSALTGPERKRRERLAELPQARVMELLAETNRAVSRRVGDTVVSESCQAAVIESTGRMAARIFDTEPFPNIPPGAASEMLNQLLSQGYHFEGPDGQTIEPKIVQWASMSSPSDSEPET